VTQEAVAKPHIHVACGALRDATGRVLLVERPPGKIAALKWEFPGGKIEPGETPRAALDRELEEEISVRVTQARPLTLFTHEYAERKVTLHTFLVTAWEGEVVGRESQRLAWEYPHARHGLDVLPTVHPILWALQLPQDYVFTRPDATEASIQRDLGRLGRGALLRLRLPGLDRASYADLARRVIAAARPHGLSVVLDRGEAMARQLGAAGVHFPQATLFTLRPDDLAPVYNVLRLASCHDVAALEHACRLGLDAAVIGPVRSTASHPGQAPIGWDGFEALVAATPLPAYAIGGLSPADKPEAFAHYAQGVAGISAYWRR
jgi:8-oxo-dGTP diphosphatase